MARSPKIFRIAVALDFRRPASRDILDGLLDHARPRGWRLGDATTVSTADGVLRDPAVFLESARPAVTVSADPFADADVRPNAEAVGRLAAGHFLDRGFKRFAIIEADPCRDAFTTAIGHAGGTLVADPAAFAGPGPLAVFAGSDAAAAGILATLQNSNRRPSGDVAVLGVGNDAGVCELTDPPLSSIDVGPRRLGRLAAERLGRLLHHRPAGGPVLVPPLGVVLRASTDMLAIGDTDVAAAVRFIHEHAAGPLRVGDVLRAVDLDRRTLERRFQKALGRSPAEVLRRHRLERAATLLRSTSLPVTDVARATGFRLPQHLAAAFKQSYGQTPSDYRAAVGPV